VNVFVVLYVDSQMLSVNIMAAKLKLRSWIKRIQG